MASASDAAPPAAAALIAAIQLNDPDDDDDEEAIRRRAEEEERRAWKQRPRSQVFERPCTPALANHRRTDIRERLLGGGSMMVPWR